MKQVRVIWTNVQDIEIIRKSLLGYITKHLYNHSQHFLINNWCYSGVIDRKNYEMINYLNNITKILNYFILTLLLWRKNK